MSFWNPILLLQPYNEDYDTRSVADKLKGQRDFSWRRFRRGVDMCEAKAETTGQYWSSLGWVKFRPGILVCVIAKPLLRAPGREHGEAIHATGDEPGRPRVRLGISKTRRHPRGYLRTNTNRASPELPRADETYPYMGEVAARLTVHRFVPRLAINSTGELPAELSRLPRLSAAHVMGSGFGREPHSARKRLDTTPPPPTVG